MTTPSQSSVRRVPMLTVRQPWASLIALGLKRIETRSWATGYRGPLAIHAGSATVGFGRIGTVTDVGQWTVERDSARGLLLRGPDLAWPYRLPLGAVVAIVDLHDVQGTDDERLVATLDDVERGVGDYSPDRYGWRLGSLCALRNPVPAKGALGLKPWSIPLGVAPGVAA